MNVQRRDRLRIRYIGEQARESLAMRLYRLWCVYDIAVMSQGDSLTCVFKGVLRRVIRTHMHRGSWI